MLTKFQKLQYMMPWGETGLDCFIQSACLYIAVMEFFVSVSCCKL